MGGYRKAVFVIVYKKKEGRTLYLLLKRKWHWKGWEFPKGGIKEKENLFKAVKREIMEETGNRAFKIKKFDIRGRYKYRKNLTDRPGYAGQEWRLFSAQILGKKIKIDRQEHSAFCWREFDEAYKLIRFPNQKKCLKIVGQDIKKH